MDNEALIAGTASLLSVGVYLFVAWRLSRRQVPTAARVPALQFTLFWLGLAAVGAIGGVESLAAVYTLPSLPVVVTLLYLEILVICAALWGLVGYLTYLFTGRNYLVGLSTFYAAVYVLLVYYITAATPIGVTVSSGVVGLAFNSSPSGPYLVALAVAIILPEFIGAILYFTLAFRTRDRTVRYRVTLVSWSLIAWFGLGSLNIGAALGGSLAAQTFARSLGVIAALVILLAYYPPAWIRSRLGVTTIDTVSAPS